MLAVAVELDILMEEQHQEAEVVVVMLLMVPTVL
jgi:hypothetical protein